MTEVIERRRTAPESASVADLVMMAAAGDDRAWTMLVQRYAPLIRGILYKHRLTAADADDVAQTVWLRLLEHLKDLREPRALPGWIATTTRNEAIGVSMSHRRTHPVDPMVQGNFEAIDDAEIDDDLLRAEVQRVIQDGVRTLTAKHQEFLRVAFSDSSITYREIGEELGLACGSIGPTRVRILNKLRGTSAVRSYLDH